MPPHQTNDPFHDPRQKIQRAKQHISEINMLADNYYRNNSYRLVIEGEPDTGNFLWIARPPNAQPFNYSLQIGDVIHNLRTALDLLACNLVAVKRANVKGVYFPFCGTQEDFDQTAKKRKIHLAGKDIVEMMRALKPYKGVDGNRELRALHDLDIVDKHLRPIHSMNIFAIDHLALTKNGGTPHVTFTNFGFMTSFPDGGIVFRTDPVDQFKVGDEIKLTPHIVFNEGLPLEYEPVIPALHQLTDLVTGIVQTFETHYLTGKS